MKTIEENNRIIAEFMGWDSNESKTVYYEPTDEVQGIGGFDVANLIFHTSWEWLMPVVEKIASEYHITEIVSDEESDYCRIIVYVDTEYSHEIFECGLSTREATYKAVIKFIKWYNKTNN